MSDELIIRQPDDWHLHLRDGDMLAVVLPFSARQFARAIVMPNLRPPALRTADAEAYRTRILAALPAGLDFTPLMTLYLSDDSDPQDIESGFARGVLAACKLYPAHATTNAEHGVTDIARIRPVLERMQRIDMPLSIHGEVTDPTVDVFDREAVFIERVLTPLRRDFPELRIVLEHISTHEAVQFVQAADSRLAATITPHHLHCNRNAMFEGGLRPHAYCLPVPKREEHRLALRAAAISGNPKFFLGTDSAPHPRRTKESACGCAGVFNAPYAIESYAQVFAEEGALERLEDFASRFGPRFYRLPENRRCIRLQRVEQVVPDAIEHDGDVLVPFLAGQTLGWRFAGIVAD